MSNEDLQDELREALAAADKAEEIYRRAKEVYLERKIDTRKAELAVLRLELDVRAGKLVIAELRTALLEVDAQTAIQMEVREKVASRRDAWRKRVATVDEIHQEIRLGKSDRPIIDKVGTVNVGEKPNGAEAAADALDNLLHASGNGDTIAGSRRRWRRTKVEAQP